jgi:hypothetical protein
LNNNRAGKRGIGEGEYIRESKEGKREGRRRLNYAIYIDFLV